ncbi:LLM class flavin-dependent oxidoreductase [Nocardia sp. NPDC058705]|uniref:LLM class flavin-dependent oxidoreductase n=1 Tax=Nocardia sp. NPDC058705 TaxID=3346609 RepID=UPI00369C3CDA
MVAIRAPCWTVEHGQRTSRLFGTLDHLSNGRAAWNAVTSSVGEQNYSDHDLPSPEQRYARATESIEVVNALFDSWQPGALRPDGSEGAVLDESLVRPIDFAGQYFSVRGPLNIPPLPQGRPVQFQAGQSAGGVELGARFAEVVFTSLPTLEDAITYTKKIRTRATELGRSDGLPLIFSSFHATYGATEEEARRLVREAAEATDFEAGRRQLADMLGGGLDLSELPLDKPIPETLLPQPDSVHRRRGRVEIFGKLAASGATLRELVIAAKDTGHWAAAGTPEQLADAIEERYRANVLDVISLGGLTEERTRDFVVNGLLPELRRRNLLDTDYLGGTYRENLELPLPTT